MKIFTKEETVSRVRADIRTPPRNRKLRFFEYRALSVKQVKITAVPKKAVGMMLGLTAIHRFKMGPKPQPEKKAKAARIARRFFSFS